MKVALGARLALTPEGKAHDRVESKDSGRECNAGFGRQGRPQPRMDFCHGLLSVGYFASWYANRTGPVLPRGGYDKLGARAQELCQPIVETNMSPWRKPSIGDY